MAFRVVLSRAAQRDLRRVRGTPRPVRRLRGNIESLTEDPRPPGARKLRGTTASWRIRVGDYRILYTIDERDSIVEIVRMPAWNRLRSPSA
ncbi:MAG: type II toxin-antitoxin system RelE/ParE family toxin [Dehalococcoidia bacterium]|nr:type II toxin-antitoxin system RelE/ParE family toxin [Dehalococcoidia bacterium]